LGDVCACGRTMAARKSANNTSARRMWNDPTGIRNQESGMGQESDQQVSGIRAAGDCSLDM
jgi:hypothetical protein